MAQRASYRKRGASPLLWVVVVLAVIGAFVFVPTFGFDVAQGADKGDDATLGIAETQSTLAAEITEQPALSASEQSADALAAVSDTDQLDGRRVELSSAESLKTAQQRTFTVEDPEPVLVLAAVDQGDPDTVEAAAAIGTTDPYPTAKHLTVDTSGPEWQSGLASAYDVASSSALTYSGRSFDDFCVTVAVPQGMEEYVGRPVEIVCDGQVVVATVTDTGGFAKYGRCLDLGGGVWRAFGCQTCSDWGLRTVQYRYL